MFKLRPLIDGLLNQRILVGSIYELRLTPTLSIRYLIHVPILAYIGLLFKKCDTLVLRHDRIVQLADRSHVVVYLVRERTQHLVETDRAENLTRAIAGNWTLRGLID